MHAAPPPRPRERIRARALCGSGPAPAPSSAAPLPPPAQRAVRQAGRRQLVELTAARQVSRALLVLLLSTAAAAPAAAAQSLWEARRWPSGGRGAQCPARRRRARARGGPRADVRRGAALQQPATSARALTASCGLLAQRDSKNCGWQGAV
ncbi:uncharacterized protein [Vicugna pacos]|uniref:Uncharacterized protein isoform X2 n=1 Tax=Vicugna pacos TaxID=30538 RepID=A0ABM5C8N5_VICPA